MQLSSINQTTNPLSIKPNTSLQRTGAFPENASALLRKTEEVLYKAVPKPIREAEVPVMVKIRKALWGLGAQQNDLLIGKLLHEIDQRTQKIQDLNTTTVQIIPEGKTIKKFPSSWGLGDNWRLVSTGGIRKTTPKENAIQNWNDNKFENQYRNEQQTAYFAQPDEKKLKEAEFLYKLKDAIWNSTQVVGYPAWKKNLGYRLYKPFFNRFKHISNLNNPEFSHGNLPRNNAETLKYLQEKTDTYRQYY